MTGETKTFGAWLFDARKNYKRKDGKRGGLTQKELAEMIDVDSSYIGKLERNNSVPSRELLAKVANVLGASHEMLLRYANREPEPKSDVVTAQALYLYDLVRRVPKRHQVIAAKFLESLANDEDIEEINDAHNRIPNSPGDSQDRQKGQAKTGH